MQRNLSTVSKVKYSRRKKASLVKTHVGKKTIIDDVAKHGIRIPRGISAIVTKRSIINLSVLKKTITAIAKSP